MKGSRTRLPPAERAVAPHRPGCSGPGSAAREPSRSHPFLVRLTPWRPAAILPALLARPSPRGAACMRRACFGSRPRSLPSSSLPSHFSRCRASSDPARIGRRCPTRAESSANGRARDAVDDRNRTRSNSPSTRRSTREPRIPRASGCASARVRRKKTLPTRSRLHHSARTTACTFRARSNGELLKPSRSKPSAQEAFEAVGKEAHQLRIAPRST